MPSILIHLTAVERLSIDGRKLPPVLAKALVDDLEYARLGAALPDLPLFAGARGAALPFFVPRPQRFASLLHDQRPAAMGFKMAQLIANGALVGREPGLAFVAGYVVHACVDRAMAPILSALASRLARRGEKAWQARARIALAQGLFMQRDFYGQDLVGTYVLLSKFKMSKQRRRAMGRGLYELLRVSCQATLGEAPTPSEVDDWFRGIQAYALVLASPWGRVLTSRSRGEALRRELYLGEGVDVPAALDAALEHARRVLGRVAQLVERGRFTARTGAQFAELFGDGPLEACAA